MSGSSSLSLVVTDVMMPRMSGKDVADHVKQARPGLPILLVSGYAHDVLGRDVTLGERCAFLAKPFSESALLDAIRALVEPTRAETATVTPGARQRSRP